MESQLVDAFIKQACPEYQQITLKIVEIIGNSGQELEMDIKWGQLTFAHQADFHHWICAIKITKKFVGLTFHFGGLLDDPQHQFVVGDSKFIRKLEYRTCAEINKEVISDFLDQAVNRLEYFKEHWQEIQKGE